MDISIIESAIRRRHKNEIVFSQMKNGPTIGGGVSIMDMWCLETTWKESVTGYEIKMSRSDFVSDEKWGYYLGMCNKMIWACPWGMINPEEIDMRCGLLYVREDGSAKLIKKPMFRAVDIPKDIYRYMMFWRLHWSERKSRADMIDEYLAKKDDGAYRALMFKNKMAEEIASLHKEVIALKLKQHKWRDIMDKFDPDIVMDRMENPTTKFVPDTRTLMQIKLMCESALENAKQ